MGFEKNKLFKILNPSLHFTSLYTATTNTTTNTTTTTTTINTDSSSNSLYSTLLYSTTRTHIVLDMLVCSMFQEAFDSFDMFTLTGQVKRSVSILHPPPPNHKKTNKTNK